MKSVVLIPYCPWPADTGGKAEIWKHLQILHELGPCRIVSAGKKPVGGGWTREHREQLEKMGFEVVLREDTSQRWTWRQAWGMAYGAVCKGLGLERAFPHSNPYHRYAFPEPWWRRVSEGADIAVINYSYWAWLPFEGPKVLVLLDVWSDYMWGGERTETRDIASCAHTFVISVDEAERLKSRGVQSVSWCPPAISRSDFPLPSGCALLGSASRFNIEGLRWIESVGDAVREADIRVYGGLAAAIRNPALKAVGRYKENDQPFQENGIVLFPTVQGMGVQIKTIEALASGRAIVARRGAIRGLPKQGQVWIEVDTPVEAIEWIRRLQDSEETRREWAAKAKAFYECYLDADRVRNDIHKQYQSLLKK